SWLPLLTATGYERSCGADLNARCSFCKTESTWSPAESKNEESGNCAVERATVLCHPAVSASSSPEPSWGSRLNNKCLSSPVCPVVKVLLVLHPWESDPTL